MRKLLIVISVLLMFCLLSCQQKADVSNARYIKDLVETHKLILPVDENTYYMSRSMFQFEENNKEYLSFGNFEKRQHEILIYDLESQNLYKRIPLFKEGPNGVVGVRTSKSFEGAKTFFLFESSAKRLTIINDKGEILRRYPVKLPEGQFTHCRDGFSYFYNPSFCVDSVVYFLHRLNKPQMKTHEWKDVSMFTYLNMKNGEVGPLPLHYPSIFDKDVENPAGGFSFSYEYNYNQNRLVCSFCGYDSLMVSDDLQNVRWYNGKSRYMESIRPVLQETSEGLQALVKLKERGEYHNLMYDKYRDVYYRFVELPYELKQNESPFDDPKGREFSIIVFDKDFNIIGETKFPGNKYFYKMSFVGRDGLYISENNLANPEFDENKLVFACFALEDVKDK